MLRLDPGFRRDDKKVRAPQRFVQLNRQLNIFTRRSREGGNPVTFARTTLGPRLRGDDGITVFNCRINNAEFGIGVGASA